MSYRLTRRLGWYAVVVVALAALSGPATAIDNANRTTTLWTPMQEWSVPNPQFDGNPFNIEGTATFTHGESGTTIRTGLFYDGGNAWKFRFAPTKTGEWTFETASDDEDLDGHTGTVTVEPNPDPDARGFLTVADSHRWAWQIGENGETHAFTPQLVMYKNIEAIEAMSDEEIEEDLRIWFDEHGFHGLHVAVFCRWFDFEKDRHSQFDTEDPMPDPRTFAVLERLITMAHDAGGYVHLWKWGDEDRHMTPIRWGINEAVDRRLQRYIAARLGPLPGWTLGYGFDLWEWVNAEQLHSWHAYMHEHLGWPRFIGGRTDAWHTPITEAITYELDYVGYETHQPDYDTYVAVLDLQPERPAMMEDRFRIRYSIYRNKDYSLDDTRRGLWRSTMAGGVANIWGYLLPDADDGGSRPFPNLPQLQTYATFFDIRPLNNMVLDNDRTDAVGVRWGLDRFVFYGEDVHAIAMNLADMEGPQPAFAIDTKVPYSEFDLGILDPDNHTWEAPYRSDWAISVGVFEDSEEENEEEDSDES